jgi:hypothetical protein
MLNDFYNNFFGTIAGGTPMTGVPSHVSFIPKDKKGGTIDIKGDHAVWLGLRNPMMQKYAYEFCYPVASVIDTLAELDLTGTVEILKTYGKGENDYAKNEWATRMMKLLNRPNPLQSWEQFRGQQVVYKKIFGFCPVLPIVPAGFGPEYASAIINIPPWCFEAISKRKILYQTRIEDIVEKYRVNILGSIFTIEPDQLFILEDSFMQDEDRDFLLPKSRLCGLDMAVSNLCAAMEADNVLLRKKGPLGFISHEAAVKDSMTGYLPMKKGEKLELQNELQRYGMSWQQFQYVVSRVAAKWNPMSFDVKQLGTKETVIASEKAVCHRFRYPYVLYEQTGATYANGDNALSDVYFSNVIPNNTKDLNKYNQFFRAEEARAKIVGNYDSVPALQEDKLNENNANKVLSDTLKLEYDNNLITLNEWRTGRGYDTLPDGDKYKKDISQPVEQTIPGNENTAPENQSPPAQG